MKLILSGAILYYIMIIYHSYIASVFLIQGYSHIYLKLIFYDINTYRYYIRRSHENLLTKFFTPPYNIGGVHFYTLIKVPPLGVPLFCKIEIWGKIQVPPLWGYLYSVKLKYSG